jgi:hypothetical protein
MLVLQTGLSELYPRGPVWLIFYRKYVKLGAEIPLISDNHSLKLIIFRKCYYSYLTEKALYQNVEKHPCSAHSTRLLTPEAKNRKTANLNIH